MEESPTSPDMSFDEFALQERTEMDTTADAPGELSDLSSQDPKELKLDDLRQGITDKIEQDEAISKTLQEEGKTVAIRTGVEVLSKRIGAKLGVPEGEVNTVLEKDAEEVLTKLFEEKMKDQLRAKGEIPAEDGLMKDEDWKKVQAAAAIEAHAYKDKSLKDLTSEAIEDIFNGIDLETFLWAILGKDVGAGRYGQRTETAAHTVGANPSEVLASAFEDKPHLQADYLARGFGVLKDKTVMEQVKQLAQDPNNESARDAITEHLKKISQDPNSSQKFMWGVYTALGESTAHANMSAEQAMQAIKSLAETKFAAKKVTHESAS